MAEGPEQTTGTGEVNAIIHHIYVKLLLVFSY